MPRPALEETKAAKPSNRAAANTPSGAVSSRFDVGDVVDGRYRVLESLAAGGMGEVFRVEHLALRKQFALKVMLGGLKTQPGLVERFKLEAMSASQIGHPNIIDVSDLGQTADGMVYFVMELLAGRTLSRVLADEGPQTPARTVSLGLQIARALAAAHQREIVHRDLKPENVMLLEREGRDFVKVVDFGIARVQQGAAGNTAVGQVLGTPPYMSPEQVQAIPVDGRSDIYSFGLILHEMLTGAPAFSGPSAHMVMLKQVKEPPPPLPDHVPVALAQLIESMLEKDPAARPQSMATVVEALERLQASTLTPTSRSTVIGLSLFAVAVVATIAAVFAFSGDDEPAPASTHPKPIVLATPPPPPAPPKPRAEPPPPPEVPAPAAAPPPRSHAEVVKLFERAQAAQRGKDALGARDAAEACLAADPSMVDCLLIAGSSAATARDIDSARRYYQRFMELAPRNHPKRRRVADLLSRYYSEQAN